MIGIVFLFVPVIIIVILTGRPGISNPNKKEKIDFSYHCRITELFIRTAKSRQELIIVFKIRINQVKSYRKKTEPLYSKVNLPELWAMYYNKLASFSDWNQSPASAQGMSANKSS